MVPLTFNVIDFVFVLLQSLLPDYQKLLSSTPSRRMNPSKLIDNSGKFNSFSLSFKHYCFHFLRLSFINAHLLQPFVLNAVINGLAFNFRVFPEQVGRDHPVHGSS